MAGRDSPESARNFIEDHGLTDFTHVIDTESVIWSMYEIWDQPAWAFINGDGETSVLIQGLGVDGLTEETEALIAA